MKVLGVDHIGIVAADVTVAKKLYGTLFGLPVELEEVYNGRDLLTFFGAGDTCIEVCTSLSEGSETEAALRARGEHIEHIAFVVEDIDAAVAELTAAGVTLRPPGITPGAAGSRTVVLDPSATNGVLVELVECARSAGSSRA